MYSLLWKLKHKAARPQKQLIHGPRDQHSRKKLSHLDDGWGYGQIFITIVVGDGLLPNDDSSSKGLRHCRKGECRKLC